MNIKHGRRSYSTSYSVRAVSLQLVTQKINTKQYITAAKLVRN